MYLSEKTIFEWSYLPTLAKFSVLDFHILLAQVEYLDQTHHQRRYTRILGHKPFIMLIGQVIELRKVRTENLKIRTDLLDLVMGGWLVTQ